jgi:hypothetical protein
MSNDRPSSFDLEYRFGRPTVYLTPRNLARLAILRSKLGDTYDERVARAAGHHSSAGHPAAAAQQHAGVRA